MLRHQKPGHGSRFGIPAAFAEANTGPRLGRRRFTRVKRRFRVPVPENENGRPVGRPFETALAAGYQFSSTGSSVRSKGLPALSATLVLSRRLSLVIGQVVGVRTFSVPFVLQTM